MKKHEDMSDADAQMLRECIAKADEVGDDDAVKFNIGAFREMFKKGRALTERQHNWVRDVYEKLTGQPVYENSWSSGKIPRGEHLATPIPEVLQRPLPLKPPTRRATP